MPTAQDIQNAVTAIDEVWSNPSARDGLFGNMLRSVSIAGIRGLNLNVEFAWPVTAIGGVNGSGKTTLIQLCSSAYTQDGTVGRHFTLGRWVGQSITAVDETPTTAATAAVTYNFTDQTPSVSIPYVATQTRWRYPRRGNPSRHVEFVGIGSFAPRIEKVDRTHQNRGRLEVRETQALTPQVVQSISRILGTSYESADFHKVSAPQALWTDEIPKLSKGGLRYTEAHMGAGEQKLVRLVRHLESIPARSLILLEEPELTLHPDAQFGLAWYLMTLAKRKGHQILIATHSSYIFEALPQQARIVLLREGGQCQALHKVTRLAAARALSSTVRANKCLILVEDAFAERFLRELIERFDASRADSLSIVDVGSDDDVQRLLRRFRDRGVRAVAVRDPDIGGDAASGLFSLPGDVSPEELLIEPANIARANTLHSGFSNAYQRASAQGTGYTGSARAKRILRALPGELSKDSGYVADRLALAWLMHPDNENAARALVTSVAQALDAE